MRESRVMSPSRFCLGFLACWLVFDGGQPGCIAQDTSPSASRPVPAELSVLKNVEPVKKRFNADQTKLRVMALVSPT
jgi:hypothetical protein